MDAPADRVLVNRVRQGEVEAYGDLVRRYQQSVFNVCYRVLRNRQDAEDLTQEALVRGFERLDTYDIDRPFGPWIHRIAANLSINVLRQRKQLLPLDEEREHHPGDEVPQPEKALMQAERKTDIHSALAELPPHYRAVVELRHFQDLNYEKIAETLGIPLNTAKSHLFRARRLLAQLLKIR